MISTLIIGADTKEGSNEPAMIGPEKPDKGEELEGDPEGPRESGMIGLIPTMVIFICIFFNFKGS